MSALKKVCLHYLPSKDCGRTMQRYACQRPKEMNWSYGPCDGGIIIDYVGPLSATFKQMVLMDMIGCICHFTKWQIHPLISTGTI